MNGKQKFNIKKQLWLYEIVFLVFIIFILTRVYASKIRLHKRFNANPLNYQQHCDDPLLSIHTMY